MRWILAILAVLAVTVAVDVSCTPAVSPNPQALARGTVETLETVWNVSANACVQVAVVNQDENTLKTCQNVLDPARASIIAAAAAVDGWTDADQKNYPCLVADAVAALKAIQPVVAKNGPTPQVIADGFNLAAPYVAQCVRPDGGT